MKYDHSMHAVGGGAGNDLFESRHSDVRSPNMPHHHHPHPHGHHSNGSGLNNVNNNNMNNGMGMGAGSGGGSNNNNNNHDQMSAMMSMFNPMMAAFIQQLASQSNILPPNAIDSTHNGAPNPTGALGI
jgi:hypothetical protein